MRGLRITLITIGIFQLSFGVVFLVAPTATAGLLGLRPAAPAWPRSASRSGSPDPGPVPAGRH